jgi:hypothetical protein
MEKKERSVNNMKADTTPADVLRTKEAMQTYLNTIKLNNSGKLPPKVNAIKRELNSIYSQAERLATTLRITKANIRENQKKMLRDNFATVFDLLNKLYKETGQIEDNNGNNNNSYSVISEGEDPNDRHNTASVGSRPSVGSDPGSTKTVGGRRRSRKTRRLRKTRRSRK